MLAMIDCMQKFISPLFTCIHIYLQHKYNEDKGQALQQEMVELMKTWLNKECFSV